MTDAPTAEAGPLARQLPQGGSFRLGPFAVDSEGRLRPDPVEGARFDFEWRGRAISAALHEGAIAARALLGRMPTSAIAAAARPGAFAALAELPALAPPGWAIALHPDHRIELGWSAPLAGPVNAPALLARLTGFLLDLAPYLDLLEEAGIVLSGEPSGTANTCPG
jgi:hypothetical protein